MCQQPFDDLYNWAGGWVYSLRFYSFNVVYWAAALISKSHFLIFLLHYHVSFWGVSAIVKAGSSSSITGITRLLIPVMVTKIVPFRDCEINWFLMKKMNLDFNWQLYCLSQTLNQIFYYLGIPVHLRLLKTVNVTEKFDQVVSSLVVLHSLHQIAYW